MFVKALDGKHYNSSYFSYVGLEETANGWHITARLMSDACANSRDIVLAMETEKQAALTRIDYVVSALGRTGSMDASEELS